MSRHAFIKWLEIRDRSDLPADFRSSTFIVGGNSHDPR
jgi:hypothetical protein